ncbi:MAG TPA: ATP-binding protein [Candidatus Limiplasma sp.]|nr:ATP-binding protein [Candidatus Limiplasma sp.]
MHVLDIAQNSVKASAKTVTISMVIDDRNWLTMVFQDDGCGMAPEFLARVTDPFTTTRTTRKVGLGIPLLKENAELTGGTVMLQSAPGVGTTVTATFNRNHIDCPPMGQICDTLLTLVVLNPETPEFVYEARSPALEASFDTRVVRQALGGVALNTPEVIDWMRDAINEEFQPILEVQ